MTDQTLDILHPSTSLEGPSLPVEMSAVPTDVLTKKNLAINYNYNSSYLMHTPFDADSYFTVRLIKKLEVSAGISLIDELVQHTPTAFLAIVGVNVWKMYDLILDHWASGYGSHPPTWKELFRVLKEMGLSELAGRMEKCLRGSVPDDPPRPPPDDESDSEEEEDDETPEQNNLRLNNIMTVECTSATSAIIPLITENINIQKANNNPKYKITQQLNPASINEELTFGNGYRLPSVKAGLHPTDVKSEEPVSQLLPLGLSTVQHHAIPFNLPGVEVVDSTFVIVTNSPRTFHWVGYGFKLTIPQGSLPAGVDQCRLDIKASAAGQYQFLDNLQLVSGVFWIHPLPLCRFQQQLTIEIQHCAKMTSSTKLSFVRACCSQKHLPYTFEVVDSHASFSEHSSYGVLEINHFSGYGITAEITEGVAAKRHYIASLYYFEVSPSILRIDFVVTWNTDIHREAVSQQYRKKRAVQGQYSALEFEKDRISLDVKDIVTTSGWEVIALAPPLIITKSEVDDFTGRGQWIPALQLQANRLEKKANLECTLKLGGAIRPTQLNILIESDKDSQERSTLEDIREDDARYDNQLCIDGLQDIYSLLIKAAKDWFDLGLALGIKVDTLEGIDSNKNSDKARLREMLAHWLRSSPSRTWRDVCAGLRSDTVQQDNLADTIEEKYKGMPRKKFRLSSM